MDMDQHPTYQSNFVHAQCGHGQQSKVSIQLYASTRSCWRQIQHLPRASKKIKPTIKEVVKKEISKLHDVRIIHPTINGQVLYTFLKQIGMTVVRN